MGYSPIAARTPYEPHLPPGGAAAPGIDAAPGLGPKYRERHAEIPILGADAGVTDPGHETSRLGLNSPSVASRISKINLYGTHRVSRGRVSLGYTQKGQSAD